MSNFLLKDPECVFIHIPKTAGTSIRKGVWKKRYEGPVFGEIPKEWDKYFKFAFVRHPFQRLLSAYFMFTVGAKGDEEWKLPDDARPLTLSEFVAIVTNESIIYDQRRKTFEEKIRHHTIPQTHPFNSLHLADFIGKYENIDEDFGIICDRLGINEKLPKMHTTCLVKWEDLLQGDDLKKCIDFYQRDFEILGYSYDSKVNI